MYSAAAKLERGMYLVWAVFLPRISSFSISAATVPPNGAANSILCERSVLRNVHDRGPRICCSFLRSEAPLAQLESFDDRYEQ